MSNQLYNAINNLNSLHSTTMSQVYDHLVKLQSRVDALETSLAELVEAAEAAESEESEEETSTQTIEVKLYGIARLDTLEPIAYKGRTLRVTRDENVKVRNEPGFQNKLKSLGLTNSDVKFVVARFKMEGVWKTQK